VGSGEGVPRFKCDATLSGVSRLTKRITNIAASVGQRLRNLARDRKEDFSLILTKFALERVLFRITQSKYCDVFVLKGALLFELWTQQRYRATRDADFLARGDSSPERFVTIFREICDTKVEDDGLRFDPQSVTARQITEDAQYQGIRVTFLAYLENARISIQIDIGFGDVITPAASEAVLPTLLDLPAPKLLAYPKESVIAEKFEAMVSLGIANSRMKDFYDLWSLCRDFPFDGHLLSEAVRNTFAQRRTKLPKDGQAVVFTEEFYEDANKKKQWDAFCNKNRHYVGAVSLKSICLVLSQFLATIAAAINDDTPFVKIWNPGGPWTELIQH